MCLYSKTKIPLIAKEDITCYKIVCRPLNSKVSKYDSVCFNFPINKGLIYAEGEKIILEYGYYQIGEGYLHSYTSLYHAKNTCFGYNFILECIIPKGSEYFISKDGDEYASDKLIIGKKVYSF